MEFNENLFKTMGDVWLGEKFTPEHSSGTCMVTTMKAAGEGVIYTPELVTATAWSLQ